jgi:hypothetical protein
MGPAAHGSLTALRENSPMETMRRPSRRRSVLGMDIGDIKKQKDKAIEEAQAQEDDELLEKEWEENANEPSVGL